MTTKTNPLLDLLKLAEGEGDTEVLALRVYTAVYELVKCAREVGAIESGAHVARMNRALAAFQEK